MKMTLLLFAAFTALTPVHAQTRGQSIESRIETAVAELNRSVLERRAHMALDEASKQTLLDALQDASRILRGPRQNPQYPPQNPQYPPQYPVYGMQVRAFADDSCTNLITEIRPSDDCGLLNKVFSSRSVWSVAIGDRCLNISDRSFTSSCESMRQASMQPTITRPVVTLYTDDVCQNPLIGLDPAVNYQALAPFMNGMSVWSLKVEDRCINIADRSFSGELAQSYVQAALGMRGQYANGEVIEFFTDDSCQNPLTYVQRGNDCGLMNQFYSNQNVWSIRFRGKCENISDLSFSSACQTYTR